MPLNHIKGLSETHDDSFQKQRKYWEIGPDEIPFVYVCDATELYTKKVWQNPETKTKSREKQCLKETRLC